MAPPISGRSPCDKYRAGTTFSVAISLQLHLRWSHTPLPQTNAIESTFLCHNFFATTHFQSQFLCGYTFLGVIAPPLFAYQLKLQSYAWVGPCCGSHDPCRLLCAPFCSLLTFTYFRLRSGCFYLRSITPISIYVPLRLFTFARTRTGTVDGWHFGDCAHFAAACHHLLCYLSQAKQSQFQKVSFDDQFVSSR